MIGQKMYTMAKKTKAKIVNDVKENPIDVVGVKDREEVHVKTVGVESETKLEADKGEGEALTLRVFTFAVNPEKFKEQLPTPQQLFSSHMKQIEVELWKDEWQPILEIEPRIVFAKDKSYYQIFIGARPAKGSLLSYRDAPKTLSQLVNGNSTENSK